jgi:hypothetical protein
MEGGTLDANYQMGGTTAEVPFPWSAIRSNSEFYNELFVAIDAAMEGRSE